jgi:mono/diheme cytochrome c family protein
MLLSDNNIERGFRARQSGIAMVLGSSWLRTATPVLLLSLAGLVGAVHHLKAQNVAPDPAAAAMQDSFTATARPFLDQNCLGCHRGDTAIAGLRVDQLSGAMTDQQMETWERVYSRIADSSMPPANARQPSAEQRKQMMGWMNTAMDYARTRPVAKNGLVRRLTVAQYKNTLRRLLLIDDNVAEMLPPDAISKEGFLNNRERLELSPPLLQSYFDIADKALSRVIVDPAKKPVIENFRVDFGAGINRQPIQDRLILGPNNLLLEPENFTVREMAPKKPFSYTPFAMKTKFRFVEGYVGNATVRGWKEFDSIYHAVFADFRGSNGYPKGKAWDSVPEGLLLRPAIPSENLNGSDGFGPKANFKIAVRELPDDGRFRVSVLAAKYDDGLVLDAGVQPQLPGAKGAVAVNGTDATAKILKSGIYQVDIYPRSETVPAGDATRLAEGLVANWDLEGLSWNLKGEARPVATPFGQGVKFGSEMDSIVIPYHDRLNVGRGDFTVSGWIRGGGGRVAGIISMRGSDTGAGWVVESNTTAGLQFLSFGQDGKRNGVVVSRNGALTGNWQHFAVSVARGSGQTRLYLDGVLVGRGTTGPADLSYRGDLTIGASPGQEGYVGDLDDFRMYRRALSPAEIVALAKPKVELPRPIGRGGRAPTPAAPEVLLTIGKRQFSGGLGQPAFLVLRLEAGTYSVKAVFGSLGNAAKIILTPLAASDPNAKHFAAFEKRTPRVALYMGFRRDCGENMLQVGEAQDVPGTNLRRYVFEGAMRNFPNPDVEPGNINYISGIRQISVRNEYTDGRDMPRLLIKSVEFEGPFFDQWPTAAHRAIFAGANTGGEAQARQIIRNFATRAFRRPVLAAEENALVGIYRNAASSGRGFRDSIKDALAAALTMPQFLFLVEKSASPAPETLDEYELASKLSYFLWNGPPDRKLLELAAAGKLSSQRDAEVGRMMRDTKFAGFLAEFVPQWLALDKFQVLEPDRRQFPNLTHQVRENLISEPVEFVRYLIANNLPASNLVRSDFVVVNETVAGYYGMGDKVSSGLHFVAIKPNRPDLGGVLSQAAILSGLSDGRESNPVKRGAWLARKIIAEPPPAPPPNVPPLQEDAKNLTLRQRIEQHRSAPACRSCHARIDPWGIVLEEYDAGGRLKSAKTEAQSALPDGTEIAGMNALKQYLAGQRMDQVAYSVLKHLATYAAGRSLSYAELDHLKKDGRSMKKNGYRLGDMIRYVAASPAFLEK